MPEHNRRFNDPQMTEFYKEFRAHVETFKEHLEVEEDERHKQEQLHEAIFRKEDQEANVPPGLLQMMSRVSTSVKAIEIANDRQKRFIGGVVFTFTCLGFFFTDTWHNIMGVLKRL